MTLCMELAPLPITRAGRNPNRTKSRRRSFTGPGGVPMFAADSASD